MEYKIILILIACYLLITYAVYNCPSKDKIEKYSHISNVVKVNDEDNEYYKLNQKELIMNRKYVFPPFKQEEIDNPHCINFVDLSNNNPKPLDNYKKLQFELN